MYILVHKVCMYSNTLRWLSLPLHCIFISKKLLSCTRGALARAAPVPQILLPDFTITQSTPSEWRKVKDKGKDPNHFLPSLVPRLLPVQKTAARGGAWVRGRRREWAWVRGLHECTTSHLHIHTNMKHSIPRLHVPSLEPCLSPFLPPVFLT